MPIKPLTLPDFGTGIKKPLKTERMSLAEYKATAEKPAKRKYKNKPQMVDGILFHSKAEAKRYGELKLLQQQGEITALVLQPGFPIVIKGKKVCKVILDFSYFDRLGRIHIEDVKGRDTDKSRLKRKLVEAEHGFTVELIR